MTRMENLFGEEVFILFQFNVSDRRMTIKKRPLKPFVEEWKTTRYVHFILFLLTLVIALIMVFTNLLWLGGMLILILSVFLLGSFVAYEDVYRGLKKESFRLCPFNTTCSEFRVHYLALCLRDYENCDHYKFQKEKER